MVWTSDFETTTEINDCRVWAFGCCEIGNTDNFVFGNSIEDFMEWCSNHTGDTLYFHNLKFDGDFIISYLLKNGWKHCKDRKDLEQGRFTTLISDKGQFYSMEICWHKYGTKRLSTKIFDSLKIIPFSVDKVAKTFGLPISKLTIDYDEYRPIGHELTDVEIDYLKNDVTIMAMALDTLFNQKLTHMTQGSNALHNYKQVVGKKRFEYWFPCS